MKRGVLTVLVVALTTACHKPASNTTDASLRSTDDVLASTLPGVVLLINRHEGGTIGFGSGIVIDDDGGVLTNLHVVADGTLGALTYDPKRVSYIPQDGGLGRYLFENDEKVIHARLVRADPTLDLALVKLDVPTKGVRLPFRKEPVKQGERVMAVGHPGETVWSFTTGVVSSLHQGMVQTDAAINRGNSGGPLIDTEGKVVAINTSKLLGDMHGIGFARPIDIAKPLIEGHAISSTLDLSTPEAAVRTCWSAYEMGTESYLDCIEWDSLYDFIQESHERLVKSLKLTGAAKADWERRHEGVPKEQMLVALKDTQRSMLRGEDPFERMRFAQKAVADAGNTPAPQRKGFTKASSAAKLRQQLDTQADAGSVDRYTHSFDDALFARTGMKVDIRNPRSLFDVMKMGRRLEKSTIIEPDRAFISFTGRNLDGTEYRSSAMLVRAASAPAPRWLIRVYPTPKDEALLPADFGKLATSYEEDLTRLVNLQLELQEPPTAKPKPKR